MYRWTSEQLWLLDVTTVMQLFLLCIIITLHNIHYKGSNYNKYEFGWKIEIRRKINDRQTRAFERFLNMQFYFKVKE